VREVGGEPFVEQQHAQLGKAKRQNLCKQCRKLYLIQCQYFRSCRFRLVITYLLEDFDPMRPDWEALVNFRDFDVPGKVPLRRS